MSESPKQQISIQRDSSRRKIIITSGIILLFIMTALGFILLIEELKSDHESGAIIRRIAAAQLNKDPNDLTDADYAKITTLWIQGTNLSDIKLLEKFTNLKRLVIIFAQMIDINENTPKWKLFLTKIGIMKIPVQYRPPQERPIDIETLTKLKDLQTLYLGGMKIKNIESLACLKELKELTLYATNITDLEPLGELENLETLNLVYNYSEILKDLNPLKKLTRLQTLSYNCIDEEQIDDLKKTFPNLKISLIQRGFEYSLSRDSE